jgi:hypothetical protein
MHLTYLGDATIGEQTNIGAGTITCNYDGKSKHETIIEDNVKIGSDTMLVAPVKVGARSTTGAGSVVEQLIGASFDVHDTLFGTGFPRTNLVESDGALLLVRRSPGAIEIFKVHDDWRVLEPVSDIGSRALFLGTRCLSVDADMFPSIDGNCVYHMDGFGLSGRMYVRDLNDGTEEVISGAQVPDDGDAYGERRYGHSQATCSHARPQSLPQLLLAHCRVLPRSKCCY